MDEDLRLVDEILNGNVDSFNIIVNKYELMMLKFVYSMIKDKEASEDITQEVFITVYNKLYTYNRNYRFLSWLYQIARNKAIDYVRKYKRVYESNMEEVPEIISQEELPEERVTYKEMKKTVEEFISQLGEVDRSIITLRYTQESLTFHEIGKILDMGESAVKRRYYKVRDKYKEFVAGREKGWKI